MAALSAEAYAWPGQLSPLRHGSRITRNTCSYAGGLDKCYGMACEGAGVANGAADPADPSTGMNYDALTGAAPCQKRRDSFVVRETPQFPSDWPQLSASLAPCQTFRAGLPE